VNVTNQSYVAVMPYRLTLECGCVVYVAADPMTGIVPSRIIQARGAGCQVAGHEPGVRLYLWELLPSRRASPPDEDDEVTLLM
jgi:hypothetical protein